MKPSLSTFSLVVDEDLTVAEADKSLSVRSVVGESVEDETTEGCSVEDNSAWMKDGLRSFPVRVVPAVLETNEPLFHAEIPSEE